MRLTGSRMTHSDMDNGGLTSQIDRDAAMREQRNPLKAGL